MSAQLTAGTAAASPPQGQATARDRVPALATALGGYLLLNTSAQFVGANLADIQGGLGASADEASWLTTAYTMALLCGVVCSSPLIATFGVRRAMAGAAFVFSLAALAAAAAPSLPLTIALRAVQGLAAGGLGPIAFITTFTNSAGPRLPFGLSLLALILLLPATLGPAASGLIEDRLGWEALFLVQGLLGGLTGGLALLFLPRAGIAWPGMQRDWWSFFLLSLALAATLLVLGQGTRRFWFESALIGWSTGVAFLAWIAFVVRLRGSAIPLLDIALLARRSFAVPIGLNLLFRTGFATTAFLIPQFLVAVQGYRPQQIGELFLWAAVPQLLAFPLAWSLLQRIDRRLIIAAGLVLFALAALLAADATTLVAAGQLRLSMALAGAGQVLFLIPNLVAGASTLKPADGPTASLLFNATTLGGTSLGVAFATELVSERQKHHFAMLAETAGSYGSGSETIARLAELLASRTGDASAASSQALATLAAAVQREAWVLAFNDAFMAVGALLTAAVAGVLLLRPQPRP